MHINTWRKSEMMQPGIFNCGLSKKSWSWRIYYWHKYVGYARKSECGSQWFFVVINSSSTWTTHT